MDYAKLPLYVAELERPNVDVDRLFRRLFHADPPDFPRHFVVCVDTPDGMRLGAYMHFTVHETGVFLLGGLGVDASIYRVLTPEVRRVLKTEGSLSRWFLRRAIDGLCPKRAVFAYTGDTRSRRDACAIGMLPVGKFLFVQWHDEPEPLRAALVSRIEALGPF